MPDPNPTRHAHDAEFRLAIERLGKWADPRQGGNPTKRMTQIWKTPMHMAADVNMLLRLVVEQGK